MDNGRPSTRATAMLAAALAASGISGAATGATDAELVAALDTEFQAAVERNDAATMDRILHREYVLVLGNGKVVDRPALIAQERDQRRYERQVEDPGTQQVRMFGPDTAIVTARLWIKGRNLVTGAEFDFRVWFSDTYVRTAAGWKYAFGQASTPLPPEAPKP